MLNASDEEMAGEAMLERAMDLDMLVNVFRDGVNGSYRTYPTEVRMQPHRPCKPIDPGNTESREEVEERKN